MRNDRWIEALMAPIVLGLLLWSQDGCAAAEKRWCVISIDGTIVGSTHESHGQVERLATGFSLASL